MGLFGCQPRCSGGLASNSGEDSTFVHVASVPSIVEGDVDERNDVGRRYICIAYGVTITAKPAFLECAWTVRALGRYI